MTSLSQIPLATKDILDNFPGFPGGIQSLVRKEKDFENEIEQALQKVGVCYFVMPVLPKRVATGHKVIFFEEAEVRVRLTCLNAVNNTGMDVTELMALVCLALHGTNPGDLLSEPMSLANPPVEFVEDPEAAVFDILFTASFQLNL